MYKYVFEKIFKLIDHLKPTYNCTRYNDRVMIDSVPNKINKDHESNIVESTRTDVNSLASQALSQFKFLGLMLNI